MLLEPTPIGPDPRRTRIGAVLTAFAVVGTLVAVVATGLLAPDDAIVPPTPSLAVAEATAQATALPANEPGPPLRSRFGLDPATVGDALASQRPGTPLTVAGWLTILPATGCPGTTTVDGKVCPREATLSDGIRPGSPVSLRAILPWDALAGLRGWPLADGQAVSGAVVVTGRFRAPGPGVCPAGVSTCAQPFVVDRVLESDAGT